MKRHLVALSRALLTTAVVLGPLLVALRLFSWRMPVPAGTLLAAYASLAWAIAGFASVRTAWHHARHPEKLARYIVAKRQLHAAMQATLA